MIEFTPKRPTEREVYAFLFTRLLPAGVTILSAQWSVAVLQGTDTGAASMVSGSAVIEGDKVSQLIIAGIAGVRYCLSCKAVFSDTQEVVLSAPLWVREVCQA